MEGKIVKFNKQKLFSTLLTFLFLFILYRFSNVSELNTLFINANIKRIEVSPTNSEDYRQYLMKYSPSDLGIPENQLNCLEPALLESDSYNLQEKTIEIKEAISDVTLLFEVLKYSYAGYLYFGNEEKWETAKNNILNQINAYPEKLSVFTLQQILIKNLYFIKDNHFLINNTPMLNHEDYYYNQTFTIQQDSRGFYLYVNTQKWYIESIEGDPNVEQYIKPSLDKSGSRCNYIGILSTHPYTAVTLKLNSGRDSKEIHVKLEKSTGKIYNEIQLSEAYSSKKINNIPIFSMRSFIGTNNLTVYQESAKYAKGKDLIILDLRGNSGGQTTIPATWFESFTGQMPKTNHIDIRLANLINNYVTKKALKIIDYENLTPYFKNLYEIESDIATQTKNKWYITKEKKVVLPNTTKIFVLIDKNVASSAEWFVESLDTLKNVVFVGTNTSGCTLSKQSIRCTLPYSKLTATYGDTISINDIEEGRGFEPDIWIGGNDTLERILAFIEKS